jgi:YbgC/YbaW family acyl-CoA thioester hydrolase
MGHMDDDAVALLDRLHSAQNEFYGGGGDAALREVLTPDISWQVPGKNAIAGRYEGLDAVLGYFARRRDLAGRTFRMHPRDRLTGEGDWVASVTDGEAVIDGRPVTWSTVGLYRLSRGRIAACVLVPLDPATFDEIWSARGSSSTTVVPVRPRHCDAQGMVYAGRYHEFFEDAYLDWLDEHAGGYEALRADGTDLVMAASEYRFRRPARLGERLTVETHPSRAGDTSVTMAFTVTGPAGQIATGRITYVAIGTAGRPVPLPGPFGAAARRSDS